MYMPSYLEKVPNIDEKLQHKSARGQSIFFRCKHIHEKYITKIWVLHNDNYTEFQLFLNRSIQHPNTPAKMIFKLVISMMDICLTISQKAIIQTQAIKLKPQQWQKNKFIEIWIKIQMSGSWEIWL